MVQQLHSSSSSLSSSTLAATTACVLVLLLLAWWWLQSYRPRREPFAVDGDDGQGHGQGHGHGHGVTADARDILCKGHVRGTVQNCGELTVPRRLTVTEGAEGGRAIRLLPMGLVDATGGRDVPLVTFEGTKVSVADLTASGRVDAGKLCAGGECLEASHIAAVKNPPPPPKTQPQTQPQTQMPTQLAVPSNLSIQTLSAMEHVTGVKGVCVGDLTACLSKSDIQQLKQLLPLVVEPGKKGRGGVVVAQVPLLVSGTSAVDGISGKVLELPAGGEPVSVDPNKHRTIYNALSNGVPPLPEDEPERKRRCRVVATYSDDCTTTGHLVVRLMILKNGGGTWQIVDGNKPDMKPLDFALPGSWGFTSDVRTAYSDIQDVPPMLPDHGHVQLRVGASKGAKGAKGDVVHAVFYRIELQLIDYVTTGG